MGTPTHIDYDYDYDYDYGKRGGLPSSPAAETETRDHGVSAVKER